MKLSQEQLDHDHGTTLHCSGPNRSNRWRRAYATHWVTADVTCTSQVLDTPYFKQPALGRCWGDQDYAQQQELQAVKA